MLSGMVLIVERKVDIVPNITYCAERKPFLRVN